MELYQYGSGNIYDDKMLTLNMSMIGVSLQKIQKERRRNQIQNKTYSEFLWWTLKYKEMKN